MHFVSNNKENDLQLEHCWITWVQTFGKVNLVETNICWQLFKKTKQKKKPCYVVYTFAVSCDGNQ